jgi:aldose 1-epimerase
MKKVSVYLFVALFVSCNKISIVTEKTFHGTIDGIKVELFTLTNSNGAIAQFTNYGGRWVSMWVPDKNGKMGDVVLGFDNPISYQNAGEPYHGAITGRVCGRIDKGVFLLHGDTIRLANNDLFGKPVKNHLHGGINGFHKQMWSGKKGMDSDENEYVAFIYESKNGEEGYPGNLKVTVRYTLKSDNTLRIDYYAKTDAPTIVNLTNHAFFNMSGNPTESVSGQLLEINADYYLECDKELIPTGKIKPVEGTPIDFRNAIELGKNIGVDFPEIYKDKGYAIAYVLNKGQDILDFAARLTDTKSGRSVAVYTNQMSFQLYNAWLMDGSDVGKNGIKYKSGCSVVLETQSFPDAPNHANFPSINLNPDELYHHVVEYRFERIK